MKQTGSKIISPIENIQNRILLIRNQKILLDSDLAALYGTTTKRLNEQIKRNQDRFPSDFMFRLTDEEKNELVANCDRFKLLRHSTSLPHAFTEYGAIMAANVINSSLAIQMSVFIVRAFVKLRKAILNYKELGLKLSEIEKTVGIHDEAIRSLIGTLRKLMEPVESPKRRIGFHASNKQKKEAVSICDHL
jgi:hypothetical protein